MLWLSNGPFGMNGKKFLLDTNAIVSLLKGNQALVECVEEAEWVGTSIISKIVVSGLPGSAKI